jgi:hypothetical protein
MTDGVYVGGTVGLQIQFLRFFGALHDEAEARGARRFGV